MAKIRMITLDKVSVDSMDTLAYLGHAYLDGKDRDTPTDKVSVDSMDTLTTLGHT